MTRTLRLIWREDTRAMIRELRSQWAHPALHGADIAITWTCTTRTVDIFARTRDALRFLVAANVVWANANGTVTLQPRVVGAHDGAVITVCAAHPHCLRCAHEMERKTESQVVCDYCGLAWSDERRRARGRKKALAATGGGNT